MQPKKKDSSSAIIYGICLVLVLYLSLHGAVAYESMVNMFNAGEIEKSQQIWTFMDLLSVRLSSRPFSFRFNQYTKDWLKYGGFSWLLVVLYIVSSRKDYIHKKEFGTSRWGTISDISDLFAENIAKAEIAKVNQLKTKFGRWMQRRNALKKCDKEGQALLNVKLAEQAKLEKKNKAAGKYNRGLHNEQVKAIKEEVQKDVAEAKLKAWPPDRYKKELKETLEALESSQTITEEMRKDQRAAAIEKYNDSMAKFFDVPARIEKINKKYEDADMLLTKTERISFFNWVLNQNTLIIGGSGSGKTRGYVMPNILQAHSSYIVTDPKGEILEKAGYFLEKIKGYKIRVLNLDEKSLSDGYNPFMYIHPERDGYEERVLSLIETIIVNTDGGEKKGGSDPFWDKAERLFLQAVFFFTTDGFVPEERNMNTVLSLIRKLEIGEEKDEMNSELDHFVNIFASTHGEEHIGVQQYREFRSKASGKTAKSIVISAVARLAPFRAKEVKRIFSYDTMHLETVGEEKTAIFVVVPPTDATFNFIAGMLFTQLFQELQYCATQVHKHEGQRLPVPCRFILDEFANTCTIPNFVKILAYARSFGIGITPILQSLEQIKNMYEKEWGVIVDNCNSLLYLGSITHMDTLEYLSKLIGKGTFDKRTTGQTKGRQGSSSQNFDVVGRELMLPDEIRKMPKKDCLLVVGGRNPFYSEKYEYKEHPNYQYTSDADRKNSYAYKPAPPPEVKKKGMAATAAEEEAKTLEPSENAKVPYTPIQIEEDAFKNLSSVTANGKSMTPINDDEFIVDDGESTVALENRLLTEVFGVDFAEEQQAKEKASAVAKALTVSPETQRVLSGWEKQKIRIEENLLVHVNMLGRSCRNLTPISDEEMVPDDGEPVTTLVNKFAEYIEDEKPALSEQERADQLEENISEFSDMLGDFVEGFDFPHEDLP